MNAARDNLGQLKTADSSVDGEDRGYAYDASWNLRWRTNNGSLESFPVKGSPISVSGQLQKWISVSQLSVF
jgi:hypothetical protein